MSFVRDDVAMAQGDRAYGYRVNFHIIDAVENPIPVTTPVAPVTSTGAYAGSVVLWPLRFATTGSYALRVTTGATTETLTRSATAVRNYWMCGDGQADSDGGVGGVGDILGWLQSLLNTNTGGGTYAVTLDADMHVLITCSVACSLLWTNGATTLNRAWWGFTQNTTTGTTATGENLPHGIWRPGKPVSFDSRDREPTVGDVGVAISGASRASDFVASPKAVRDLRWVRFVASKGLQEYQDPTEPTGSWQYAWRNSVKLGRPLRYYENETSLGPTTYGLYRVRVKASDGLERSTETFARWSLDLALRRV